MIDSTSVAPPSRSVRWVVLGPPGCQNRGIHRGNRPPNTALGRWPLLLPIVVICANASDATIVNALNAELLEHLGNKSAPQVWQAFCDSRMLETMLTHIPKFYACRIGKETGIWIGFPWSILEHNFEGFPVGHTRKFSTFREAMLFMLKKGDLASKTDPPPSYAGAVAQAAADVTEEAEIAECDTLPPMQSAFTAGRRGVVFPVNPVTRTATLPSFGIPPSSISAPAHALRSARSATTPIGRSINCGPSRSVSPIKRTPATSTSRVVSSRSASPSKRSTRSRSHVKEEDEGPYLPLYRDDSEQEGDPSSPEEDTVVNEPTPEDLAQSMRDALALTSHGDMLRVLFRPVPEQDATVAGLPPLTLGPRADEFLARRQASDETFVTIFRIFLHARDPHEFASVMGLWLNWPVSDPHRLWRRIDLPQ